MENSIVMTANKTGAVLSKRHKIRLVVASSIGNWLEWFDFTLYSFFAVIIGKQFFPSDNAATSILISVAVFGVGFLMRPLGSVVIGCYADRHGRKSALMLTIVMMGMGRAFIAFTPPYQTIGLAASVMIVAGRLLQGFCAGGEVGSATTLLAESAAAGQKGRFVAWKFITQALAAVMGAGCGALLSSALAPEQLETWGWRLPFVFAMVIIPVGLYIRKQIDETLVLRKTPGASRRPLVAIIHTMPRQFVACIGMIIPGTMLTYTVMSFLPTYMQQVTAMPPAAIYSMAMIANIVNAVACYTGGVLYDRLTYRKYTIIA